MNEHKQLEALVIVKPPLMEGEVIPPGMKDKFLKREELALKVIGFCMKLKDHEMEIRELWLEFSKLGRGELIAGCHTKSEFCHKHLHRHIRTVNFMLKKTEDERKLMAKYSQEIVKVMKGEKPKFRVFKEFDYELDTMRRMKKVKKTNEEFPLKVEVLCKHFINLLSPAILESAVNEQIEEFKHKEDKEMLEELWSQLKEIL
jgi:hypothetical protein